MSNVSTVMCPNCKIGGSVDRLAHWNDALGCWTCKPGTQCRFRLYPNTGWTALPLAAIPGERRCELVEGHSGKHEHDPVAAEEARYQAALAVYGGRLCPRQVHIEEGFPPGQCLRSVGHEGLCDAYDHTDDKSSPP